MSWWCSGFVGRPWTWEYRPLVGVWILVGLLAGAYALALRARAHGREAGLSPTTATYARRFGAGLALLALSSEWPLGPLGAGYLASAAALRFLLMTFGVAPLLLLGTPPWLYRRMLGPRRLRLARVVTQPWVAFLQFNFVMVMTQLPPVVDGLKVTQAGSFLLDMAAIASAMIMWVPVLQPIPELPSLRDPIRMVYLFGLSVVPTVPASFLTFASFPLYRIFELSPRVFPALDPVTDQQIAGLGLKIIGGLILWGIIAVLFFRWAAREEPDRPTEVSWPKFERDLERYDLRRRD